MQFFQIRFIVWSKFAVKFFHPFSFFKLYSIIFDCCKLQYVVKEMAIRQILRESFIANVNTNALFGLKMQFYASECNSKKVIQKLI